MMKYVVLHEASRYEASVLIGQESVDEASGGGDLAKSLACMSVWCVDVVDVVAKTTQATTSTLTMLARSLGILKRRVRRCRRYRRQGDAGDDIDAHDAGTWHCQGVILYEPGMSIYSPDR